MDVFGGSEHATAHIWRPEDSFRELILSFHLFMALLPVIYSKHLPTEPSHQVHPSLLIGPAISQHHNTEGWGVCPQYTHNTTLRTELWAPQYTHKPWEQTTWVGKSSICHSFLGYFRLIRVVSSVDVRWNEMKLLNWMVYLLLNEEVLK